MFRSPHITLTSVLSILFLTGLSFALASDWGRPAPNSLPVRAGFVRLDQLVADMSYDDMLRSPEIIHRRLAADPGNPYRWAELAEYLENNDRFDEAERVLGRAITLGPEIPPILMRAANFYLLRDKSEKVAEMGKRILSLTAEFDQILFVNYLAAGLTDRQIMQMGVPYGDGRAARAWLVSLLPRAKTEVLLEVWEWLRSAKHDDQTTAEQMVNTLWQRSLYSLAAQTWGDWLAARRGDYLQPNLLANSHFAGEPASVPCDWKLGNAGDFTVHNGLSLKFNGSDPGAIYGAAQLVPVTTGHYSFTAEIAADNLTTDEGPYFRFYDAEKMERFNMMTPGILGTQPRHAVHYEFVVPEGTRVVGVQIERRGSLRFDNKITGTFLVHKVSLVRDFR